MPSSAPSWARRPARPLTSSCPSGPASVAARRPAAATAGCSPARPGWARWGWLLSRLSGSKGSELREGLKRQSDKASGGWDRVPEPGSADPVSSAEVTQLHTNGAGSDPARTPPS